MANFYNPYMNNPYYNNPQYQQPIQQPAQQTIHNGGIINVQSEQEARNYPVAPATSVTFHNENEPYIYTKTVTNSLEPPKFEKFKLVKEENAPIVEKDVEYIEKSEFEAFKAEFEAFKTTLEKTATQKKKAVKKDDE